MNLETGKPIPGSLAAFVLKKVVLNLKNCLLKNTSLHKKLVLYWQIC